jgi:alkylation response protein AidB-like acyl-CoA dehydrogenase
MDFTVPPVLEELRARVRAFLEDRVLPQEARLLRLEEEIFPACVEDGDEIRALQREARALGVWAGHLPKEAGGMGLSVTEYGLLNEVIGRAYFGPRIFGSNAPDSGNAELLWLVGTPEQKERFFWPLQRAEVRSFFGMTEPEVSGSDPTLLRTTAVQDGEHWVIDGHKWFSSNANGSAFGIVMAATEAAAPPHQRFTQILVPTATKGLTLVRPLAVMGHRTGPGHWEVRFERCRVPLANTLGQPGQGFALAQARLGPGRIHHCMRWIGQAQRALELLCAYAKTRTAFGGPLAEKQTVQDLDRGERSRDRGRPPAHPERGLAHRPVRRPGSALLDLAREVLRGAGPPGRARPRHPGARRPGHHR